MKRKKLVRKIKKLQAECDGLRAQLTQFQHEANYFRETAARTAFARDNAVNERDAALRELAELRGEVTPFKRKATK